MPQATRNLWRRVWLSIACLGLCGAAGCSKKKAPADSTAIDQPHPPDSVPGAAPIAMLERTGCYGECPVYRLTVSDDGSVVYVGTRWVKVLGRQVYKLPLARVAELQTAFERANFIQLHDYDRVESTDDDWALLALRHGASFKHLRHYHGDNTAPPALSTLEDEFDRIVGSGPFVGVPVVSGAAPAGAAEPAAPTSPAKPAASARATENAGPPDEVADPDNHP
jgi:hypothetical protein